MTRCPRLMRRDPAEFVGKGVRNAVAAVALCSASPVLVPLHIRKCGRVVAGPHLVHKGVFQQCCAYLVNST
jgi:hypothetical protein